MLREWCPLVLLRVKFYTNVQWKNWAPLLVQQSRDTPLMADLCSGLTRWGRQPAFPKEGQSVFYSAVRRIKNCKNILLGSEEGRWVGSGNSPKSLPEGERSARGPVVGTAAMDCCSVPCGGVFRSSRPRS